MILWKLLSNVVETLGYVQLGDEVSEGECLIQVYEAVTSEAIFDIKKKEVSAQGSYVP